MTEFPNDNESEEVDDGTPLHRGTSSAAIGDRKSVV